MYLWTRKQAVSRRYLLTLVSIATAILVSRKNNLASATESDVEKLITEKLGRVIVQNGRITLDIPETAENSASVQFTIVIDSQMTSQNYVKVVYVLAEGNPSPLVASYYFTPYSGRAQVTSRMRLAQTQNVRVLAIMSDGSAFFTRKEVRVVSSGCN